MKYLVILFLLLSSNSHALRCIPRDPPEGFNNKNDGVESYIFIGECDPQKGEYCNLRSYRLMFYREHKDNEVLRLLSENRSKYNEEKVQSIKDDYFYRNSCVGLVKNSNNVTRFAFLNVECPKKGEVFTGTYKAAPIGGACGTIPYFIVQTINDKESESYKINGFIRYMIDSAINDRRDSWNDLKFSASDMSISFESIAVDTLLDHIAGFAYRYDGVAISHGVINRTTKVDFAHTPWAQILDKVVKESDLKMEYNEEDRKMYIFDPGPEIE